MSTSSAHQIKHDHPEFPDITVMPAYAMTPDQVISKLGSTNDGLSDDAVIARRRHYGQNELKEGRRISHFGLIIKQFKSWLVIVLLFAAAISWFAGELIDTLVIMMVVLVNAAIGYSQEYKAEKAIASLKKLVVDEAKVMRNGVLQALPSVDLVPGDIIVLEEGDSVPADARIVHSKNLRTSEASLTGESVPTAKHSDELPAETTLADRRNMVLKGTFVVAGYARCIVTGTGHHTALGDISSSLGSIDKERTNFMKKTDTLAKQMSMIAIGSAVVFFMFGYFVRGFGIEEVLLISIAVLVAAIPEGLPAVISIVLAIGAHRMARRKAIVREFTATETLGSVSAILTDKTGTLTQNTLTVQKVFIPGEEIYGVTGEGWFPAGNFIQDDAIIEPLKNARFNRLLRIATFSNNSVIRQNDEHGYELIGDPTEGALAVLAEKAGVADDIEKLDDLPFDSIAKLRATLVMEGNAKELLVTGAPERIIDLSSKILTGNGECAFDESRQKEVLRILTEWSNHALRVIALAYRPAPDIVHITSEQVEDLVFVGLVGMKDPPRPDIRKAVESCKRAGIRVLMVTGDHVNTAVAIARETGILPPGKSTKIAALTQSQLERLSDAEFEDAIERISVFARLTPAMKLRIVDNLQGKGELVAVTGDGVNDAPALKKAHVGVAMGIMGTDVARDVSDVVLADDNFSSIVNAVEEGRIVFANARQASFFLITTNIAEIITLLTAIAFGLPLPLTATQLLWLNLVTDGVTVMALAAEKGHGDVMKQKPVLKSEKILNRTVIPFLLINVLIMVGLAMGAFYYFLPVNIDMARTGVFIVMAFTQLFNVLNMRSLTYSVFKLGLFSNKYINWAILVSSLLLIAVTEVPFMADIFHFHALPIIDFLILFGLSSLVMWVGEIYKFIVLRNGSRENHPSSMSKTR